jgi:peptidoglycan/xylan/chitin deacetylase (PgdA/CDA1 family)
MAALPAGGLVRRLVCAASLLALAGCATEQIQVERPRDTIVARTDDFVLVRASATDTVQSLAKTYLNDESLAPAVAAASRVETPTPGQIMVIPLKAGTQWAIDPEGYQVVPILCYHQFGAGSRARNKMEVSQNAFEQQMAYLKENGYQVVPLADMDDFLNGRKALPPKAVVITIDDGYRSSYEVAYPILRKYGFPATIYVYSDFTGTGMALTWDQMKEMRDSGIIDIQSHSKSHTSMSLLPNESAGAAYKERVAREVSVPEATIEGKLGEKVRHFAYPYGDTSPTVLSILAERGYVTAATVQRGANPVFADPLLLRRDMVYSDDTLADFKKYVTVRVTLDLR